MIDLVLEKVKGTGIKVYVDDHLTSKQCKKIHEYRIRVKNSIGYYQNPKHDHNTCYKRLIEKNSLENISYLSIYYYPNTSENLTEEFSEIMGIIDIYVDSDLAIYMLCIRNSISKILGEILQDKKLYSGQILKFDRNRVDKGENLVSLAIKIWEEKRLYIKLCNIGTATYEEIKKYKNYEPSV